MLRVLDTFGAQYFEDPLDQREGAEDPAVVLRRFVDVSVPGRGHTRIFFENDRFIHDVAMNLPWWLHSLRISADEFWEALDRVKRERGSARP